MAEILLDTCILSDISNPDSDWHEWSIATLEELDSSNTFLINPVIYAEASIVYDAIEQFDIFLRELDLNFKEVPLDALFVAGKAFLSYRRNSGTRKNVLPDFFIGAHAAVSQYHLITRDKGRFSSYFPSVKLISPAAN